MNSPAKQDKKKSKVLPINRFLPAPRRSSPFEKEPEPEIQQIKEQIIGNENLLEAIKKIAADIEELKRKICGDQGRLNIMIPTQDTSLPDDLLKQLKGEKIELGSQGPKSTFFNGKYRELLTTPSGHVYYFFDEIAKYPSPHMVTLGPTGSGMHNLAKTQEDKEKLRAAADYGLNIIKKMQSKEAEDKYKEFLRAVPLSSFDNMDIEKEDTLVLKEALKSYELLLKREERMRDVDKMLLDPRNDPVHNSLLEKGVNNYQESAERIKAYIARIKAELVSRGAQEV
jgi:hypothetical protein